jgi:hypothetical protein
MPSRAADATGMGRQVLPISFPPRAVTDGAVTVLRHLYWYTVQYGFSVKQATGAHQDDWVRLPQRLRSAKNAAERDRIIKGLERLAAGAEERLAKKRAHYQRWPYKEIVLTAELSAALAAFPDSLLDKAFARLMPKTPAPTALRPVKLEIDKKDRDRREVKRGDYNFVEPDALLLGGDCLLMIEAKTKGHAKASRRYPPRQLLNYLRLAEECQHARTHGAGPELPTRFAHLILVPTPGDEWLTDGASWVEPIAEGFSGRLVVKRKALLRLGGQVPQGLRRNLDRLLDEVPVFYRSWHDLHQALESAIDKLDPHEAHWRRICGGVKELAKRAVSGIELLV